MFSVDLSTRECDGHVVVALRGELDLVDAAGVAAALATVAAREPQIIVDLAALEFIDSSGVAALARGRTHARHSGGDLLLAAPRQPVLRVLAVTRLVDDFSVHASVEAAAGSAERSRQDALATHRRAVRNAGLPERSTVTRGSKQQCSDSLFYLRLRTSPGGVPEGYLVIAGQRRVRCRGADLLVPRDPAACGAGHPYAGGRKPAIYF
jgi:anti-sigma B factor antagonist